MPSFDSLSHHDVSPHLTANGYERANRAAQFMPFAALRGFYELIQQQERVMEPRHELTEEEAFSLSQTMTHVTRGTVVRVVYYDKDAYVALTGCVSQNDMILRRLSVIQTTISYDDIRSISIVDDGA